MVFDCNNILEAQLVIAYFFRCLVLLLAKYPNENKYVLTDIQCTTCTICKIYYKDFGQKYHKLVDIYVIEKSTDDVPIKYMSSQWIVLHLT